MTTEQKTTQKAATPKSYAPAKAQPTVASVDDQDAVMEVMRRAEDGGASLTAADGALLQRSIGNRATGALLGKGDSAESLSNAAQQSLSAILQRIEQSNEPHIKRQEDNDELNLARRDTFFRSADIAIQRTVDGDIQRDIWDYLPSWGSTTTTGEAMDTTSATLEAVDEGQKVSQGLEASSLLAEGSKLKQGSDLVGSVGGAISGTKDMVEAGGSMREEGLGVESGLKMVGGMSGLAGGVVKGADAFGGEQAKELLTKVAAEGGETIGGWLDFISGGTKALSGVYLTGKSQLAYTGVKSIFSNSTIPQVKSAAETLMSIINEKWWLGMWDVGIGTLDMAATSTFPGYTAIAKATGATSKLIGGDIIWKTVSYASGGRIRSNDDIDDQIGTKVDALKGDAMAMANAALLGNDLDNLKNLYLSAKAFAPDFAESLSSAVKMARVNGLTVSATEMRRRKQSLKGIVWDA